jgi:hypothetical protein
MDEKVAKGFATDFPGLWIDEVGVAQPTDSGVDLRRAHAKFLAQFGIAFPDSG